MAAMAQTLASSASDPGLNVGSPRTRAAMRVLGILPRDVQALDVTAFSGREAKHNMFDQKRRNLIEEVRRKADSAPDVSGRHGGDGGMNREERNQLFMEQVARAERENMATMAKLAKKDVQSVVIQELETKLQAQKNKKRQEEGQARVKALLKERDDELANRKKLAEKKQERIQEVRNKNLQHMLEHSNELQETIQKKNERAMKQVADLALSRLDGRAAKLEKGDRIRARQEGFAADMLGGREKAYSEHCDKMDSKVRLLEEKLAARQSHAEEIAAKQQECVESVRQNAEEKQAAVEAKYWEACGRHSQAARQRDEELKARIKEYQVRNTKRKQAHETRLIRIKEDIEKNVVRKYQEFEKKDAEFEKTRAEAQAASAADLQRFFDHRTNHIELAHTNRQRLRRAHHYSMGDQVEKLHQMRQKVQIMQNAKSEADQRRMVVMSRCAVEKMHLTDRVDRVKNSKDPDKMQSMLEDLDPDPEAIGRINELLSELGMQTLGFVKDEEEGK